MTQKSFRKNPYTRSSQNLPAFRGDWMATMPASETKTGVEYKWDIPTRSNPAVKLLLALHQHAPALSKELKGMDKFTKACENWFTLRVLKDAGFATQKATAEGEATEPRYNMRSARCFRATEWAKQAKEADLLKRPRPPNPLQHTTEATTLRFYAEKGAADNLEAGRRIANKRKAKNDLKAAARLPPP